jgi:hypothetical protein
MKNCLRTGIIVGLILMTSINYGQKVLIENDDVNHFILRPFDLRARDIQGTSYITENFLPAKINEIDKFFSMRYDAYIDEMEIEIDGEHYHLPKDAEFTITFTGLSKTYKLSTYKGPKGKERGYFLIDYHGNDVSLLVKERIKYFKEVPQNLGFVEYQPPKLKRVNDELFFGFANGSALKVPKKKKEVLNLFSSKAKNIEGYAREKKIGFKSKEDLNQILTYYDTIR